MNILMVGDTLAEDKPGGGGTYLSEISKRLAAAGHHVITLVQKHDPLDPSYEILSSVPIYRFGSNRVRLPLSLLSRFRSSRQIFEELADEIDFDLIWIHFALGGFGVLKSPKSALVPCLFTFHGPWPEEALTEKEKQLENQRGLQKQLGRSQSKLSFLASAYIERRVTQRANRFLVLSQHSKELLTSIYGVPTEKIFVAPGGVDTSRFCPSSNRSQVKSALGMPLDRPILLTIRRLVARMGLENLIEAMRLVLAQRQVQLIIGGTGHRQCHLRSLISKYNLDEHVKLEGHIPEEQLSSYYQAADLFVLPSIAYEGFGLVTLEALSSGVPVLGTAVGGTIEILEKLDPNLLIQESKPESIADGILNALDRQNHTSEHYRRFVEEHYSWEKIFPKIEEFLTKTANTIH